MVEGSTNGTMFETYLEEVLCPALKEDRVVTDDLSAQKGERVSQPIETKGCEPVYLPPYSPDFDPIEQAFYLRVAPHATLV